MKKRCYVTDIQLFKHGNGCDTLIWVYAGREYQADGDFYIDNRVYLHHSFFTPRGKEIEFKVKYF